MIRAHLLTPIAATILLLSCADARTGGDHATDAGPGTDAGTPADAGPGTDAGTPADAGTPSDGGPACGEIPASGDLLWAHSAGSATGADHANAVAAGPDCSIYVAGSYWDGAILGQSAAPLSSAGSWDIYVARYTQNGGLMWMRHAGGTGVDDVMSAASGPDGSITIVGWFGDTMTFADSGFVATTISSDGHNDLFVARYDASGNLLWARRAGSEGNDMAKGVAVGADGSATVVGEIEAATTFSSGEPHATSLAGLGLQDAFVVRYASNGDLLWATEAGGTGSDSAHGVAVASDGSAVVTGKFNETATFGTGDVHATTLTSVGDADVFVAKFSAEGHVLWATRAGSGPQESGLDDDQGNAVALLPDGASIITGGYQRDATFGDGEPHKTTLPGDFETGIFVAKYDASGQLVWAKSAHGADWGEGQAVATRSEGSFLLTGFLYDSATFGPNEANETTLRSAGRFDTFVASYAANGALVSVHGIGGGDDDFGDGLALLPDGTFVVTGTFGGSSGAAASLGTGVAAQTLHSAGQGDAFVARFAR